MWINIQTQFGKYFGRSIIIAMSGKTPKAHVLCPSSKCQEGAKLIGVVKEDGHVDMLKQPLEINEEFVLSAKEGRIPESRFRFANTCLKGACEQWDGCRCSVIDGILDHISKSSRKIETKEIRECTIRPNCRWFNQNGMSACLICPLVVTDVTHSSI